MFAEHWFYDFIIYVYALSLLFAFADLLQPNPSARRLARVFLVIVWVFQAAFFASRVYEAFPMLTGFDSLMLYSLAIITFTLIIYKWYRMDLFVFCANVVGFTVAAVNIFIAPETVSSLQELLLSELVFIHVTMAFLA